MNQKGIKPGLGYVDSVYTKAILPTVALWKKISFITPNWLTTFGVLCSGGFLVLLFKVLFKGAGMTTAVPAVLLLMSRMYFDYADGLMARSYGMTSKIGGWYDHISDVVFFAGLAVMLGLYDSRLLFVVLPLYISSSINIGCMENRYEREKKISDQDKDKSLSMISKMCPLDSPVEAFSKIFDNGVLYIAIAVTTLVIASKNTL